MRRKSLLLIIMMMALLLGCGRQAQPEEPKETAAPTETVPVRQLREGIQTVLVLCLDDYELPEDASGYRNPGRADFVLLLAVDAQQGTITPVQLNPDTVVSFKAPGAAEPVELPIGQVFSYGSGGSDSFVNLVNSAANLMGITKIDHYLSFTMDSVGIVNDMIGGVTVSAGDFFPAETGAESKLLSGAEAMEFFSFRDAADAANADHMLRQCEYMRAFYGPFMQKTQNDDFLTDVTLQLGERMATDLTLSQLILMFENFSQYRMEEQVLTPAGNAIAETVGQLVYE